MDLFCTPKLSIKANNCATADESSHTYAWGQIISLPTDYLYRGLIIVALSPQNTLLAYAWKMENKEYLDFRILITKLCNWSLI